MSENEAAKKLKIMIADDHIILTQLLSKLLETEDIEILPLAHDGAELETLLEELHPDIIVSDIEMPGKSIFEIAHHIHRNSLDTRVILFSMHQHPEYVFEAMESHVNGYLTKNADKDELMKAIRHVQQGHEYYSDAIRQIIIQGFKSRNKESLNEQNPLKQLTRRENEIIKLLVQGLSSHQIAERLFVSPRTVSNHRANMLQKCQVSNTIELVRLYLENERKW